MIKDFFVSFRDNFKDKVKNPFLGTYLLVWLLSNWQLIFLLFNFDKGVLLKDKIKIIDEYFVNNPFFLGVFSNVVYAFLVLVVTYLLLNISRGIVNIFEKQLKPLVYKKTDISSIVLREDFEILKGERDNLLIRINKERDEKAKVESELKNAEEKLNNLRQEKSKSEEALYFANFDNSPQKTLFKKLKENQLLDKFIIISNEIKKGNRFNSGEKSIDPFVNLGLIELRNVNNLGAKKFNLTNDGEVIFNHIRFNE